MKFKKLLNLKKRHCRQPRASAFMLESLEPRLLLSATPMTAAVVTTDHLDYAPGETAVITTSNQTGDGLQFAAGELVRFQVSRTDGMADNVGTTADVGPTGNEAWYVIDGIGGFTAHQQFDAMGQAADRDGNGIADADEPLPGLALNFPTSTPQLAWSAAKPALVLEFTDTLSPANWQPVTAPRATGGGFVVVPDAGAGTQRFYRLREP